MMMPRAAIDLHFLVINYMTIKIPNLMFKKQIRPAASTIASTFFGMFNGSSSQNGGRGCKRVTQDENETVTDSQVVVFGLHNKSVVVSDIAVEKKKKNCSGKFLRVLWRVAAARKSRLLLKRISARRRRRSGAESKMDQQQDGATVELCKRRILMGVKCRPINASGKLHYGEDGVILPEDLSPAV